MAVFKTRTQSPSTSDKNFIQRSHGGKNAAIKIGSDGSVLPNCVGYVHGRWLELLGVHSNLSLNNASTFYGRTSDGYQRGQHPRLGAVACWTGGYLNRGHVAIVEAVHSDGSTTLSWSDYGGKRFTRVKMGVNNYIGGNLRFQGYVYIPMTFTNTPVLSFDEVVKGVREGKYGNMPGRKALVEATGHSYEKVQAAVNSQVTPSNPTPAGLTFEQVVQGVMNGNYGNGGARIQAVNKTGHDYNTVQAEVNKRVGGGSTNLDAVARDVFNGKYGNGTNRVNALRRAGFDPVAVQRRVNELYYS